MPEGGGAIASAAQRLRAGGLVAFPTETVYGLGADAANAQAMARLYAVKGRPGDHPVIVHFATAQAAFAWACEVPEAAHRLARAFWPGPLTLILRRAPHVGDFVTGGQDTVGLRVPAHPLAQQLLAAFGGGVAAPSANRYGRVSPTTAQHVRDDLGGDVDQVLDGGPCEVGIESTIVDCSRGTPVVLRPGGISAAQIAAALAGGLAPAPAQQAAPAAPAPRVSGSHAAHYAPRTPARLVAGHALDAEIARLGAQAGVLAFSRPDERVDFWLRMPADPQAYAQRLYGALRELDAAGCAMLLVESPPESPPWSAVLDRLRRACRD
jgi:L-threonylcarbamoyladenylate synthase